MKAYYKDKKIDREAKPLIKRIPANAVLLDISKASAELTKQYGRGYGVATLRRLIRDGKWAEGYHYHRTSGGLIKVYLENVRISF